MAEIPIQAPTMPQTTHPPPPPHPHQTLIFTYGTLKQNFPNHPLLHHLITQNDAVYLGPYRTLHPLPLIVGPNGIPYLLNLPGHGHRVLGELYAVSAAALVRLDELEGTGIGHYERLPIMIRRDDKNNEGDDHGGVVEEEAEVYCAHRSFAEKMWEKKGEGAVGEYTSEDASFYVRKEDRVKGRSSVDEIWLFLSDA